jgi:beta-lactamase class A
MGFGKIGAAMRSRPTEKVATRLVHVLCLSGLLAGCATAIPRPDPRPVERPAQRPAPAPKPVVVRPNPPQAQPPAGLDDAIRNQWRAFPGKTGVAVMRIDGGWTIGQRVGEYFPQQSVSKTWVAMTVLDQVDQGRLRLDQRVRITSADLAVFHQPIRDRVLANGEVEETVMSLLEQAITASDNSANDALLRTAGGPDAVRAFIAKRNLGAIRFGPGERAMQSAIAGLEWQQTYSVGRRFYAAREALPYDRRKAALDRYLADPVDGASPAAIVAGLARLAKGELLSASSTQLLLGIMGRVRSGPNRLKAGVPSEWRFVHKTGTGQDLPPVSTGYNDIGIMTAPDGTRYALAVMISDTTASVPARMAFMQSISRIVAQYHQR